MIRGRASWWGGPLRCVAALLFIAPILWLVAASLKPTARIHEDVDSLRSFVPTPVVTENYVDAWQRGDVAVTFVNSLVQVLAIAGAGLLINSAAGFAFARMRFPGRDVLFMILVATIIVPIEAIAIPLYLTLHRLPTPTGETNLRLWTLGALSVPFMAKAFNIYLLRQAFLSVPRSLDEAAFLDGAGWWSVYWRVALPNVRHALVTAILLDFVVHWNDFLWPLIVCSGTQTRTVQLGLENFFTQPPIQWGSIMAYATLATVPVLLIFTLGQRWIVASLATSGERG